MEGMAKPDAVQCIHRFADAIAATENSSMDCVRHYRTPLAEAGDPINHAFYLDGVHSASLLRNEVMWQSVGGLQLLGELGLLLCNLVEHTGALGIVLLQGGRQLLDLLGLHLWRDGERVRVDNCLD